MEDDDAPNEFEISPHIEVFNIHHAGGVIEGPVLFQYDDSVRETIESLLEDFNLPGSVEDYNLYVTDNDGKVTTLKRNYPVEDYLKLIESHKRIEVSTEAPQGEESQEGKDKEA